MKNDNSFKTNIFFLISLALIFLWSAYKPHDYFTWFLEVAPVIIGTIILITIYKRFQFTQLAYLLIWIHCIILMVGGHYTYERVPLFNYIKEIFDMQRNNYDKVGHFAQGFIPAIISREILIRKSPLTAGKWLSFIVVCICLSISAVYELIEWWVAITTGDSAESFLGTQGYAWDTQSDMAYALFGSIISLILLSKIHDRYLKQLSDK